MVYSDSPFFSTAIGGVNMTYTVNSPFDAILSSDTFHNLTKKRFNANAIYSQLVATPDNTDWQTGAELADDNVRMVTGNNIPQGATILRERETTNYNQVAWSDATEAQQTSAQESGSVWWWRDTTTQEHQNLFNDMGLYTGEGEAPPMGGEGMGGDGTNTYIGVETPIMERIICLVGDCSDVNSNSQRMLSWFDNDGDGEMSEYSNTGVYCYDENDEYICDDDGNLLTDSNSGGGYSGGMGEQQDDAIMVMPKWVNPQENKWLKPLLGISALGGVYYYEKKTGKLSDFVSSMK